MTKETARLVVQLMQTVVHEGTASKLRWRYNVLNDVAGKTGTTQANADGWFMAATPNLVVGTWVGADDMRIHFRTTELGQGSSTALPIFGYFMNQVNKDTAFHKISEAKFPPLSRDLSQRLACDLYEIDDVLWAQIAKTIAKRDSTIKADTLAPPPPETFLEKLYKRKDRMLRAAHARDSINDVQKIEDLGG